MSEATHTRFDKTSTEFVLATAVMHGRKVATLDSVRRAVLKFAVDYEADGEPAVAVAFRLFAEGLGDDPLPVAARNTT